MPGIRIKHENTQATVLLEEDLVASLVPDLKNSMRDLIQKGTLRMQVDLAQVQMVDSTGIGCLIAAHNSLAKSGGSLTVTGVSQDIYELFCSMRLNRHFTIQPLKSDETTG